MVTKIAVDVMGGDLQDSSSLKGVELFLTRHLSPIIHLFGPITIIDPWFKDLPPPLQNRVVKHHTDVYIDNNTTPKEALRNYPNSSMKLCIESIKNNLTHACVSSGNTGALVALSTLILKTLNNISRPAIAKNLPVLEHGAQRKNVIMLDLGANPNSNEQNLFDNAVLGDALFKIQHHREPEIRLLNIGMEDIKGSLAVKQAHKLLQNSNLNYQGFIEPNLIFSGACDIIIADGFSGNVALKTAEGVLNTLSTKLKNIFQSSAITQVAGMLVRSSLNKELKEINPKHYNGACILGLNGIIVKSHGNSDHESFYYALKTANQLVENKMLSKLQHSHEH